MINQMWSNALLEKCGKWQDEFTAWAMKQPNGLIDPIEWMRQNGLPSSDPAIAEAYKAMQIENRKRQEVLWEQYQAINPYPVRRFKKG